MSAFLHQIFYANNKFDSNDPITYEGKPSPVIPRTPTLRYGVLTNDPVEFYEELSKWAVPHKIYISNEPEPDATIGLHGNSVERSSPVMVPTSTQVDISSSVSDITLSSKPLASLIAKPVDKPVASLTPFKNLSIFQSMFLLQYGYAEYMMSKNRMLNRELEEKQKIMETLSKTPKKLKEGNHKLTNDNIQEILSGLLVATKEEIMHLVAYAFYYNRIIYLVFTHSYLVISPTKNAVVDETNIDSVYILNQTRKHPKYGGSYFPDLEPTLEKLGNIHKTKINLEHYAKPFKGVSAYKLPELEEMATKIGIFENGVVTKYKKKDLYDKIVEMCCAGICA
jgi:hypothetical protein